MRPYSLCFKLSSFNGLPAARAARAVEHFVSALAEVNRGYLDTHQAPLLYQSGVRYERDRTDTEMQWWDIPAILSVGYADCKGLAAWRIAELQAFGYSAEPVITMQGNNGHEVLHVQVRGPRGLEDPSEILGMYVR